MIPEGDNSIDRAAALLDLNRASEAIPILTKALAENPQQFYAACLLARCFLALNENERGLEYAEKAIEIAPEIEWGHRLRSVVLGAMGKNKESLSAAEDAARLAPYDAIVMQCLANARLRCGQTEAARTAAEKMLEIAPGLEDSHMTLGNVFLGMEYYQLAEKHFREALRINPNSADARNNLGVVFVRRYPDSGFGVEHFAEAIKTEPNKALALENLRSQLSVIPLIVFYLLLFPIAMIGIVVLVIFLPWVIVGMLAAVYKVFEVMKTNSQKLRELPQEFHVLFRSGSFKTRLRSNAKFFWRSVRELFYKIWPAYVFAVAALILRIVSYQYASNPLWIISLAVYLAGFFILYLKFKKVNSENKIFEG